MPNDRFFSNEPLKKNSLIILDGAEANHCINIMRNSLGDVIEVIDGKGHLAQAKITNILKKTVELKIEEFFFEEEKNEKIILIQSIIKAPKMELLLEKCTELGCREFWFFNSKNSETQNFSENKLTRMNLILISALKQSGALYLPIIKFYKSLPDIQDDLNDKKGIVFFGDTNKKAKKLNTQFEKNKNVFLIIGPEKGFTEEEISFMLNKLNAIPVKLNENILRAETAAIAAIAQTSILFS